jgi:hypothetical protein
MRVYSKYIKGPEGAREFPFIMGKGIAEVICRPAIIRQGGIIAVTESELRKEELAVRGARRQRSSPSEELAVRKPHRQKTLPSEDPAVRRRHLQKTQLSENLTGRRRHCILVK